MGSRLVALVISAVLYAPETGIALLQECADPNDVGCQTDGHGRALAARGSKASLAATRSSYISADVESTPWNETAHWPIWRRKQKLRAELLDGYNSVIPPDHVEVQVGMNFFKIHELDLKTSHLSIAVWFRMQWVDDRLRYNETVANVSTLTLPILVEAHSETDIWHPDVELYNSEEGLEATLANKFALVSPAGEVFWSRPGLLRPLCKFDGLWNFPWDTLSCKLEIGAWTLDGDQQNIVALKADGGITWSGKDGSFVSETQGSAFQDYTIKDITERRIVKTYLGGGWWPELLYEIRLSRAVNFYLIKLVIPQVCMAIASWVTYWMSPEVGERLGFGITLLLAVTATDIVAIELMPVCNEFLVMNAINVICFITCLFSLLESAVVLCLHHCEEETLFRLVPGIFRLPVSWICKRMQRKKERTEEAQVHPLPLQIIKDEIPPSPSPPEVASSDKVTPETSNGAAKRKSTLVRKPTFFMKQDSLRPELAATDQDVKDISTLSSRLRNNLFRQVFWTVDEDFNGYLDKEEINKFGKFMLREEWTDELLDDFMRRADRNKSGSLSLEEFTLFCEQEIARTDPSSDPTFVAQMVNGFIASREREDHHLKNHWKTLALAVDEICRSVVPAVTGVTLLVLLCVCQSA